MTAEITITKGDLSVTIETEQVSENFANKLAYIRPPQTKQKQETGPINVKVIDLLIVTHELLIRGKISPTSSKTAKEIKEDLISIFKGANTTGGPCTVVYADDNFNMFMEKCLVVEKAMDEPITLGVDVAKYDVQITLTEGILA